MEILFIIPIIFGFYYLGRYHASRLCRMKHKYQFDIFKDNVFTRLMQCDMKEAGRILLDEYDRLTKTKKDEKVS